MRILIVFACVLIFAGSLHGQSSRKEEQACVRNPKLVAKCFDVHGRLSFYNGAPSARIWKIGTKRLLGVHDSVLPGQLGLRMTSSNMQAFGDFRVCPLTREKPGVMQIVCIASARHVKYKKAK
jgi:hypothetical protein